MATMSFHSVTSSPRTLGGLRALMIGLPVSTVIAARYPRSAKNFCTLSHTNEHCSSAVPPSTCTQKCSPARGGGRSFGSFTALRILPPRVGSSQSHLDSGLFIAFIGAFLFLCIRFHLSSHEES